MKIKRISIIVLICAMLCSCFDYAQSISFNKGKYRCYYRIIVGNSLSAMGSLFGEQSTETDPEEIFKNFDGLTENLPECATINKIQNSSGTGIEIIMEIDPKHIDKNMIKEEEIEQVLPHNEGKKMYIPFLLGSQKDTYAGDDESGMTAAMFSSAKCQIFLGKSVKHDVQVSYFAGDDDILPIDCYDYGDSYCLDIPVAALLSKTTVDMNYIIVE